MRIEPLPHYRPPRYPTHLRVEAHPELLRLVPRRWRGSPAVLAALGATCVLLDGCARSRPAAQTATRKPPASLVAPVFRHGSGQASFGCVSISPPTFMTEDEARAAIAQEARAAGLRFVKDTSGGSRAARTAGVDKARNVHYEFVSMDRAEEIDDQGRGVVSTAWSVDTVKGAEKVRQGLATRQAPGAYAVFYQPKCDSEEWRSMDFKKAERTIRAEERALLKAQVRDFVKWLKAQGVI